MKSPERIWAEKALFWLEILQSKITKDARDLLPISPRQWKEKESSDAVNILRTASFYLKKYDSGWVDDINEAWNSLTEKIETAACCLEMDISDQDHEMQIQATKRQSAFANWK